MILLPPSFTFFPYTTLFRSLAVIFITPLTVIFADSALAALDTDRLILVRMFDIVLGSLIGYLGGWVIHQDRKSTRLNSSHVAISYAVFCLKKKNDSISYAVFCIKHKRSPQ